MKLDLSRHAPVGLSLSGEWAAFFACLFSLLVTSIGYIVGFNHALSALYFGNTRVKLIPGATMPSFYTLLGDFIYIFVIEATLMLLFIIHHYAYHYQGSKSIYLMRRLPSRWELHRRCLTLPVAGAVVILALGFALVFLFYRTYMAATPPQCLMPDQLEMLWSVLL